MRYFRRTTITALAVVAGAFGAPAAYGGAPPALAGVNVVSGSRAAYVDVQVPRAVRLRTPFGGGDDIAVSGGAATTAIVLVGQTGKARGVTIAGGAATVNGAVEKFLMPIPAWPALGGGTYEDVKSYLDTTLVPAGTYRLYFVSSGPATVTLRLPGLSGKRSIAPRRPTVGAVLPANHELSASPTRNNVFAASNTANLGRRGFGMHLLQAHVDAEATWQLVMCHQKPALAPAEQLRNSPACPAGEKHTLVNHRYPSVTPDSKLFVQAFSGLPAGEHALGTVFTSQSKSTVTGYSAVWIEY